MRPFTYAAVRADGKRETGRLVARDRESAASAIRTRGAFPLSITPDVGTRFLDRGMNSEDTAVMLRLLAVLLAGGMPVSRALSVAETAAPVRWRAALPDIATRIQQGSGLADSLRLSDAGIPQHVIGIIEAGEQGAGLSAAVASAAATLETAGAQARALRNALAYPLILLTVGAVTSVFLVGAVIPRFAQLIEETGDAVPPLTAYMISIADHLVRYYPVILGGFLICGITFFLWLGRPGNSERFHRGLHRVPLLGPLRHAAATARLCASLGALLGAGVPIARAMQVGASSAGDPAVEAAMHRARERTVRGERLTAALREEACMTETAIALLQVGEEGGQLASMFEQAASIESQMAVDRTRTAIRMIEPALILIFGALVMFAAAAMLQAMYGLRATV